VAVAGTFDLAAVMAAEPSVSFEATPAAPATTLAPPAAAAPAPPAAPRTVVVVRRHVVTGDGSVVVRQSAAPVVGRTPALSPTPPPPPAPAPAPVPDTATKGS
jgi:hypothetical protein